MDKFSSVVDRVNMERESKLLNSWRIKTVKVSNVWAL
jgi:hypothetical protein